MKSSLTTVARNVWNTMLTVCTGIVFAACGARPEATILACAGILLFAIGGSWAHRQSSVRRNLPETAIPSLEDFSRFSKSEWLGSLAVSGIGMILLVAAMLLASTARA